MVMSYSEEQCRCIESKQLRRKYVKYFYLLNNNEVECLHETKVTFYLPKYRGIGDTDV